GMPDMTCVSEWFSIQITSSLLTLPVDGGGVVGSGVGVGVGDGGGVGSVVGVGVGSGDGVPLPLPPVPLPPLWRASQSAFALSQTLTSWVRVTPAGSLPG